MKQRETEIKRTKTGRSKQRDRDGNRLRELLQLPPGREYFGGNLAISEETTWSFGLAMLHAVRKFTFCLAISLFAMGTLLFWTRTWELSHLHVIQDMGQEPR